MTIIAQGAEATIEQKDDTIIKTRVAKTYRHPQIDQQLRKLRTRAESRILEKLQKAQLAVPKVMHTDEKQAVITMEFIDGKKLRDVLNKDNVQNFAKQLGKLISDMHRNNIVHSDLTTSNMIVKDDKLYLIDFGLSYTSTKIEDKAVDLHLLQRALDSYHYKIAQDAFQIVLKNYKQKDVIERLDVIEKRGRYKQKH